MRVTMNHVSTEKYLIVSGKAAGQIRIGADIHGQARELAVAINDAVSIGDRVLPLRIKDSAVRTETVNRVNSDGTIHTEEGSRLRSWVRVGDANTDALNLLASQVKENLLWTFMEEHAMDGYDRSMDLDRIMRGGGYEKRLTFSRVGVRFRLRFPTGQEQAVMSLLLQPLRGAQRRSALIEAWYVLDLWHGEPGCQCARIRSGDEYQLRPRLWTHLKAANDVGDLALASFNVTDVSCAYCRT